MSTHRAAHRPPADPLPGGGVPGRSRAVDQTRALLGQGPDPAYAEAAARRRDGEPAPPWSRPAAVAAVLVLGVVLGVAYADTRAAAPSSERTRQALVSDVGRETDRSSDLQERLEELRAEVALALDRELTVTEEGRSQAQRVTRLEAASGVLAVTGPGLRVTVSDAEPEDIVDPVTGEPVTAVPEAGLVLDIDLQAVVNALWAAGAEAVSVDGERLSSRTSIRTAGEAILVDFQPITSPYVVEAIGGADLVPSFAGSQTAGRYDAYRQLYGIGFELAAAADLSLPAAADTDLRYAGPRPEPAPGQNE